MLGDLFLITVFSTWRSQLFVNTFTYQQTSSGSPTGITPAQDLGDAFESVLFTPSLGILGAQFASIQYTSMRVVNLFNETDYYEKAFSPVYTPSGTGDTMPPFVAVSLRTQWLGGVVRRGFKRFSGLLETFASGGIVTPAALTAMSLVADNLTDTVSSATLDFGPCVVKRIKEVDPVTGAVSYRLPATSGEAVSVLGINWDVMPELTTQNSRKIGRGM